MYLESSCHDDTEMNRGGGAGLRVICGGKVGGLHGYHTRDDYVGVCVCLYFRSSLCENEEVLNSHI